MENSICYFSFEKELCNLVYVLYFSLIRLNIVSNRIIKVSHFIVIFVIIIFDIYYVVQLYHDLGIVCIVFKLNLQKLNKYLDKKYYIT